MTVTVHSAPSGSGEVGVKTYVVDAPLGVTVKATASPSQVIENAFGPAVTGSLKVMEIVAEVSTSPWPGAGVVTVTNGAWSPVQGLRGDAVFRGSGGPATKSAELTSVSWQPRGPGAGGLRRSAVVFDVAGAGPGAGVVSQQFATP